MTTPLWRRMRDAKLDAHIGANGSGPSYAAMLRAVARSIPPQLTSATAVHDWLMDEAKKAERLE